MKITEELVDRVFRQVNEEIEKDYPSLDMATLLWIWLTFKNILRAV